MHLRAYVNMCLSVCMCMCVCVAFRVTREKGLTRMNCFCVYQHIYFFCNDYENIFFFLKSRKLVLKYSHEIIVFIYVFWTIFVFEVDEKWLTLSSTNIRNVNTFSTEKGVCLVQFSCSWYF